MKIYLDNCSLQRPLDDKSQTRIRLEAEAIIEVLLLCESGELILVSSEILETEIERMTHRKRKRLTLKTLSSAKNVVLLNDKIEERAFEFESRGFKVFDALHLASAEAEQVDYFCTCDDKFLRRAKKQNDLQMNVVSPLELAQEVIK